MTENSTPASTTELGISMTRTFEAPRELVWKAWTEPERFADWFGGGGGTVPLATMDVRPGGEWQATMIITEPEHREIPFHGVYREVVEPERLVLTMKDRPGDEYELVTVTLNDAGDNKTEMLFQQSGGNMSEAEYGRAKAGWGAFFDRLAEGLAQA